MTNMKGIGEKLILIALGGAGMLAILLLLARVLKGTPAAAAIPLGDGE